MSFTYSLEKLIEENPNGLLAKHETWQRTRLGDVCSVQNGYPFESKLFRTDGRGFPLLRIRNILDGFTTTRYSGDFDPQFVVSPGDLVVGMDGDFNARLWRGEPALLNQRVCRLVVRDDRYSGRFLAHAVQGYLRAINDKTSSITVKHLSSLTIQEIPLPLPPLEEQERVADTLDSYLSRLDAGVQSLAGAKARLRAYRASVLKAAVEGRLVPTEAELAGKDGRSYEPAGVLLERILKERRRRWEQAELAKMKTAGRTPRDDRWKAKYEEPAQAATGKLPSLPEGWLWATLEQLIIEPLANGKSVPDGSGFPVLRLTSIRAGRVVLHQRKTGDWGDLDPRGYVLRRGDLLIVRGNGSIHLVGRAGLVTEDADDVAYPDTLIRARIHSTSLLPELLAYIWDSPPVRKHLESRAKTTAGIHKVNQSDLAQTSVPLPPLVEQHRILEEIDRLLSVSNATNAQVASTSVRTSRLRQAVLAWAFEGKLVDQDTGDAPADVLLVRIRSERAAAAPAKPKQKGARRLKAAS